MDILYPVADLPTTPFREHELDMALHKMRHRRAPGPDHAPVELWKFAPRQFRLLLLSHYTEVFATASSPSTWSLAHIVMIFKGKKKDPKLPSNYRPISLVNTVYKIYASMLHTRLKLALTTEFLQRSMVFGPDDPRQLLFSSLGVSLNYMKDTEYLSTLFF